ncbi:hypothetical protein RHGRI_017629 [Rhododendron griersonianum]|uniref:Uncharacterized protein n=1 Tax=Rhododendron griersonianum TaxID=479676 RepID=A0AAV6JYF6_9ERIC|nr:hypothetical protein RHGRI_017629 [Rhododendron griersonianum]
MEGDNQGPRGEGDNQGLLLRWKAITKGTRSRANNFLATIFMSENQFVQKQEEGTPYYSDKELVTRELFRQASDFVFPSVEEYLYSTVVGND